MGKDTEAVSRLFEQAEDGVRPVHVANVGAARVIKERGNRILLMQAPAMPLGFFGSVTFTYQAGDLVKMDVMETLKP